MPNMSWFNTLPGFQKSPAGLERQILRRLPRVLWVGTALAALLAGVMGWVPWSGGEVEIAAAWLHDTVEDCPPTSFEEIAAKFGVEVAAIGRPPNARGQLSVQVGRAAGHDQRLSPHLLHPGQILRIPPRSWPLNTAVSAPSTITTT